MHIIGSFPVKRKRFTRNRRSLMRLYQTSAQTNWQTHAPIKLFLPEGRTHKQSNKHTHTHTHIRTNLLLVACTVCLLSPSLSLSLSHCLFLILLPSLCIEPNAILQLFSLGSTPDQIEAINQQLSYSQYIYKYTLLSLLLIDIIILIII